MNIRYPIYEGVYRILTKDGDVFTQNIPIFWLLSISVLFPFFYYE